MAFEQAAYMAAHHLAKGGLCSLVFKSTSCLQVCFYHAPGGRLSENAEENTRKTRAVVQKLIGRGFMTDYAPGDRGSFFRVVVNVQTLRGTIDALISTIEDIGRDFI